MNPTAALALRLFVTALVVFSLCLEFDDVIRPHRRAHRVLACLGLFSAGLMTSTLFTFIWSCC